MGVHDVVTHADELSLHVVGPKAQDRRGMVVGETTNDAGMQALVSAMAACVRARWRAIGRRAKILGVRFG